MARRRTGSGGAAAVDDDSAGRAGGSSAVVAVLLLVLAAASLVTAVVLPLNQLTQPGGRIEVRLTPSAAELAVDAVPELPAASALSVDPEQTLLVLQAAELPAELRLLTEAPASLRGVCTGAGALLAWLLLRSIREGRPFDRRNPRRIVGLAGLVVLGGLGGPLLDGLARFSVLDHLGATGPESPFLLDATWDLAPLVLAGLLLALADAFRRGVRLTDDVQGLV